MFDQSLDRCDMESGERDLFGRETRICRGVVVMRSHLEWFKCKRDEVRLERYVRARS